MPPERQLLALIQAGVPLVRRPFDKLAELLDSDCRHVIDGIANLKRQGIIREISGIFDVSALGYSQALIAFCVEEKNLDSVGASAASHPGVSHCYARDGAFNLWFTLAISPQSQLGLKETARIMASRCGAEKYMILPSVKRYKLDMRIGSYPTESVKPVAKIRATPPTETQIRAIHALQLDLPLKDEPFDALAKAAGMSTDELLVCASDFLACGWLRRYGAMLHHRRAGAAVNVMVALQVDDGCEDEIGQELAKSPQISHCFHRQTHPNWPFNLYIMIHGQNTNQCQRTIEEILSLTAITNHVELWTKKEYKKQRIRLFDNEEKNWETPFVANQ